MHIKYYIIRNIYAEFPYLHAKLPYYPVLYMKSPWARAGRPHYFLVLYMKILDNTGLHVKHVMIRSMCGVSVLFTALYASIPYYAVLYMKSPLSGVGGQAAS